MHLDNQLIVAILGVAVLSTAYAWGRYLQLRSETGQLETMRRDLAVADERYRSLFEYNPHAVFSVGLEGQVTSANHAGEQLTGRAAVGLLGMNITELIAPEDMDRALDSFARALDRQPQHIQARIVGGQASSSRSR